MSETLKQWRVRIVYREGVTGKWSAWNDGPRPVIPADKYEVEERTICAVDPRSMKEQDDG